jgi:chaperonin GroEL
MHEDLAILTGGIPVSQEVGVELHNVRLVHLGEAARVVVDRRTTTIVDGAGDASAVERRVEALRAELAADANLTDYDRDKLRERMARLGGRIAAIGVGAATETELLERRHRVEDAVRATRAALEEGVVAGGGAALLHARGAIDTTGRSADEITGAEIVRRALEEPIRQIARNAGLEPSTVVSTVTAMGVHDGLDADTGSYGNLLDAGVIDPVMVTRSALANAASIAKMILTTECIVAGPAALSEDV